MISAIEHSGLLTILYWLLMLPIAIVVLMRVTSFWAEDGPGTLFGAVRTILAMVAVVFLTYDFSGYVFACMMQAPQLGISFPPHYHYWNWIQEPQSLKWHVLGFVPMIRYLPVLFALCVGAMMQVLLWKIPFRVGLIVFVSQLVIDIFAMAMLSLVFSFFVGVEEGAVAHAQTRHAAGRHAGHRPTVAEPTGLRGMQRQIELLGAEEGPRVRQLWRRWESANQRLRPVYDTLDPVTRHLPLPVRDFLTGGGWLIAIPGLIGLAWYSLRRRARRVAQRDAGAGNDVGP